MVEKITTSPLSMTIPNIERISYVHRYQDGDPGRKKNNLQKKKRKKPIRIYLMQEKQKNNQYFYRQAIQGLKTFSLKDACMVLIDRTGFTVTT